ncbi:MAG: KH domain-containing protein [Clostridia bacterium]|nr:KH domain-containing protein [Clostridia bacterium]
MLELVKLVVETFADNKGAINYDVKEDGKNVDITITLDPSDMGKVIGRQGKIAKALRTLVRAGSLKENKKYNIEIKEKDAE